MLTVTGSVGSPWLVVSSNGPPAMDGAPSGANPLGSCRITERDWPAAIAPAGAETWIGPEPRTSGPPSLITLAGAGPVTISGGPTVGVAWGSGVGCGRGGGGGAARATRRVALL